MKWNWVHIEETLGEYVATCCSPLHICLSVDIFCIDKKWKVGVNSDYTSFTVRNLESEEQAKKVAEELGNFVLRTYNG